MSILAGIDIETTNSDHETGGLLSLGIAMGDVGSATFYIETHPGYLVDWSYEAMKVNGFTPDSVHDRELVQADYEVCAWLESHNIPKRGKLIPVGWNVGSFDVQYIKKHLPNFFNRLKRHAIDLNSVYYYLLACGVDINKEELKRKADSILVDKFGMTEDRHNALFDARAALVEFALMREYK